MQWADVEQAASLQDEAHLVLVVPVLAAELGFHHRAALEVEQGLQGAVGRDADLARSARPETGGDGVIEQTALDLTNGGRQLRWTLRPGSDTSCPNG